MPSNLDYLVDLIFKKLKNYKAKEILLKKESLNKFISSLFKENWTQEAVYVNCYSWIIFWKYLCLIFLI